jgi:hypothetical protein
VHFALTHPLLPLSFRSNELSVAQAWSGHLNAPNTTSVEDMCYERRRAEACVD